jgi:hypothetical protein
MLAALVTEIVSSVYGATKWLVRRVAGRRSAFQPPREWPKQLVGSLRVALRVDAARLAGFCRLFTRARIRHFARPIATPMYATDT